MRCEQARQLFDAYLDGELSPSLATELGAHRLRCSDCRRALALLEVSGHVVAHDGEATALRHDFVDRLLSCTAESPRNVSRNWATRLYIAGPLAAAAVVLLALLGFFDRGGTRVAGHTERAQRDTAPAESVSEALREQARGVPAEHRDDPYAQSLDDWARKTTQRLEATRESGASLQQLLDAKMSQFLESLNQPAPTTDPDEPADGTPEPSPTDEEPPSQDPAADDGSEDSPSETP